MRRLLVWVLAVALLAAGAVGVVAWQHDYALREEPVRLAHAGHELDGVLAMPEHGDGPFGLVVFVHGDGPVDATHETFYRPIWESLAAAGYASLSFSKPGVAGSTGDWLAQTMDDRAAETLAAIAWARTRPELDGDRIGLWGASQAGWVLPKVAAADPGVRFAIAVSPAVNWLRQGRFHLLATLADDGATPAEVDAAVRRSDRVRALLREGADHAEYRAALGEHADIPPERWRFAAANHTADATADLTAMAGTPVLLALAGRDRNVDVAETEAVYRDLLPAESLTVRHYPDAAHSLVDRDGVWLTATGLFAPRSVFADGFLADLAAFVRNLG